MLPPFGDQGTLGSLVGRWRLRSGRHVQRAPPAVDTGPRRRSPVSPFVSVFCFIGRALPQLVFSCQVCVQIQVYEDKRTKITAAALGVSLALASTAAAAGPNLSAVASKLTGKQVTVQRGHSQDRRHRRGDGHEHQRHHVQDATLEHAPQSHVYLPQDSLGRRDLRARARARRQGHERG